MRSISAMEKNNPYTNIFVKMGFLTTGKYSKKDTISELLQAQGCHVHAAICEDSPTHSPTSARYIRPRLTSPLPHDTLHGDLDPKSLQAKIEPRHEKTGSLHMRKQRRRSVSG